MDTDDITLLFPPFTEARLFPYLSLPMLCAFLRQNGIKTRQRDLNLEICHELFSKQVIIEKLATLDANQLGERYRMEMLRYSMANHETLASSVFRKDQYGPGPEGIQHDVRIVRQVIELLSERSLLKCSATDFRHIAAIVDLIEDNVSEDVSTRLLNNTLGDMLSSAPRVVGISVTFFSQLISAFYISAYIKARNPHIQIILGGQQIMQWHNEIITSTTLSANIDALCVGAGEQCLYQFVKAIKTNESWKNIPELIDIKNPDHTPPKSTLDINSLPPPDFDDLKIHGYLSEETQLSIVTCVGCYWGRCVFCSYGNRSYLGDSYQQAGADWIASTVTALIDKYGIHRINMVDENTHLKYALKAAIEVKQRGYFFQFSTRNRLENCLLDARFCKALAENGCVLMSVGYETNCQRLLDKLNKGVIANNYQQIIDNLHTAGIPLRLSVMGGILDETEFELDESCAFLARNAHKIGIDVMQMLVLEPNTILARDIQQYPIRIKPEPELRGNEALNYAMGRVGYNFNFDHGKDFDERLEDFKKIFYEVTPLKNDEISPTRQQHQSSDELYFKSIKLKPWVATWFIETDEDRRYFVSDLLWQNTYEIRDEGYLFLNQQHEPERDSDIQLLCRRLLGSGMVAEVEELITNE